jgi:hypothetical protein
MPYTVATPLKITAGRRHTVPARDTHLRRVGREVLSVRHRLVAIGERRERSRTYHHHLT